MKTYKKSNDYPDLFHGEKVCCTCGWYIQHYRSDERCSVFFAVNCGHCIFPRIKTRAPDQSCENWKPLAEGEPGGEG